MRDTNRWSVYRLGWGALLAGLELLTGGDPPMTMRPGDKPVPLIFGKGSLFAGDETFGTRHLVSPWKRGGSVRISHVALRCGLTAGIRLGEGGSSGFLSLT